MSFTVPIICFFVLGFILGLYWGFSLADNDDHKGDKEITNADLIRAMTDEELANFMMHFSDYVPEPNGGTPEQCWLNWLKQEVTAEE